MKMTHELDDWWTLHKIVQTSLGGPHQHFGDGNLFLRIAANGNIDRTYSKHYPDDGSSPNTIEGTVTPNASGYDLMITEFLPTGRIRPYRGSLVTRLPGLLIMSGVRRPEQLKAVLKKRNADKLLSGQEDGVWVATKP